MARRENPGGSTRPTATTSPGATQTDPLASNLNAGTTGVSGTTNYGGVGGIDTGLGASGQGGNLGNNQNDQGGVAQQAKEQVRNLADDAKRETSRMASQAGDMVQGLVSKQKDQAAQRLGSVAGALRDVGNRLNEQNDQDGAGFGQYAVRAADQVDRLSGYLRDRDLGNFVRDTESFARRHPDVFLGGTFLAGLLLARFLKSSSSHRDDDWNANAYASYPASYPDNPGRMDRRGYAGEPFDDVNPQAYASYPGERFGRGAEFGGPPEPHRSEDRKGPYGTPIGVRFPDTPEGA